MISVEFDDPSNRLTPADRELAAAICTKVDTELCLLLPALADIVHLRIATRTRVIPRVGYGGSASAPARIDFTLDPDHPGGARGLLETHLRPTLFHECHHLVRGWVKHGSIRPRYFIEGVICEGLACAFERDAGGPPLPWTSYPDNVREWVDEMLALPAFTRRDKHYAQWMFIHPDGRRWIGYRAGTFIADRAIAASGRSAGELATADYAQILRLADLPLPARRRIRSIFKPRGW